MKTNIRIPIFMLICGVFFLNCNDSDTENSQDDTETDDSDLQPSMKKVTYSSDGEMIVANLFIPGDYTSGQKLPAIVINPPATGVKEQTIGLYAEKLSRKGYITLAFDPRGFGESEGQAQLLDPYRIGEDIKNSISFLRTLEEVDINNVFSVGMCAGSGYAAYVASFDSRVKALAIISPYMTGAEEYWNQFGGAANLREHMLPAAAAARQKYYATGEDTMGKLVPETQDEIDAATPIAVGMRDYYLAGKPGDVPNWKNELSYISIESVLSFSAYNFVHMFESVPLFAAYGDKAVSAEGAIRFFDAAIGPKKRMVLENAGHFDLYWKLEYVEPIADNIAAFFKEYIE